MGFYTIVPKRTYMGLGIGEVDQRILSLIIKGYSSPYAIWVQTKKEADIHENVSSLPYKTINQHVKQLQIAGALEVIKTDDVNIHGRKDYRITAEYMGYLVPYILDHPEYVKTIVDYMDKYKMDKKQFGTSLLYEFLTRCTHFSITIDQYEKHTNLLQPISMNDKEIEAILKSIESITDIYEKWNPEQYDDYDYQTVEEFAKSKLQKKSKKK